MTDTKGATVQTAAYQMRGHTLARQREVSAPSLKRKAPRHSKAKICRPSFKCLAASPFQENSIIFSQAGNVGLTATAVDDRSIHVSEAAKLEWHSR